MRELALFYFLMGLHMLAPFLRRFPPKQRQEMAHLSMLLLFQLVHLLAVGSLSKDIPGWAV